MLDNSRREEKHLVGLSSDTEKVVCSNTAGTSTLRVVAESGDDHSTGRDESSSIEASSMADVLTATEMAKQMSKKSPSQMQSSTEPRLDALATKGETENVAHQTTDHPLELLDRRVVDVAEQTIICALENFNSDVNTSFILCVICNALHDLLFSILQEDTEIRKAFETAEIHVTGGRRGGGGESQAKEVAKLLVGDPLVSALIETLVVETA